MEKKNQEIIAYRVGDHFLCPECYERSVKILAVHEIEPTPAKAVKRGDIESFICKQCESMKELSEMEVPSDIGTEIPAKGKATQPHKHKEKDLTNPKDAVQNVLENAASNRKDTETKIDMIGEIARMGRKAKFIKKTLHAACEGRRLSRKNIITLRTFFDNLGEKLDTLREMITNSILDDMAYRDLLFKQARRNFLTLTPEEQKYLRMRFSLKEKYGHQQDHLMS